MKYYINITTNQININSISCIFNKNAGAVVSFFGSIRTLNNSKKVKKILYITFNDLFISILKKKCLSLLEDKKHTHIYIIQASGLLSIGQINSIISVSSDNRHDAFYICKDLVETLKYSTPVWKKEFYIDGSFQWLNV